MILGAAEAIQGHGLDPSKILLVGYDAIPDALNYIKLGKLDATIEQFPGRQAREALRLLVDYIRYKKMPPAKEIYITPIAIDANNLDQAEQKAQ